MFEFKLLDPIESLENMDDNIRSEQVSHQIGNDQIQLNFSHTYMLELDLISLLSVMGFIFFLTL